MLTFILHKFIRFFNRRIMLVLVEIKVSNLTFWEPLPSLFGLQVLIRCSDQYHHTFNLASVA